jgi:hypothetical protein
MIEIFIIFGVVFFIAVLFYKQANEQFEILQIGGDRLEELPTLYAERSPIVVSGYEGLVSLGLGTETELRKRPNILQMTVGAVQNKTTLRTLLDSPAALRTFQFPVATAEFLAQESGLATWFKHSLYEHLLPSAFTKWFYSARTSLWLHHRGMFRTKAFQTAVMATQGVARVSLMLGSALPYLPGKWEGRQFASLTAQDTPLLSQVKFVEVTVRPGTILLLPPHMIVDISSGAGPVQAWSLVAEIHHPISGLA